jgi:hypothetical protein
MELVELRHFRGDITLATAAAKSLGSTSFGTWGSVYRLLHTEAGDGQSLIRLRNSTNVGSTARRSTSGSMRCGE